MAIPDPAPKMDVKNQDDWIEDIEYPTDEFYTQSAEVSQPAKINTMPYILFGYEATQSEKNDFSVSESPPTMVIFQLAFGESTLRNPLMVEILVDKEEQTTLWSPDMRLFGIGSTLEEAYEALSSELIELRDELEDDRDHLGKEAQRIYALLTHIMGT